MARKGLFAALEDYDVEDSVVFGDTPYGEDIEQADSEARDEMEEAEKSSEEIDNILGDADEGIEDTETLQEIGGAIGEAAETEVGIDEVGIAPTIIATEALCRNLGMENFKIMPALESFNSTNSRVQATKRASIAIEGVVSEAIERIKKALKLIGEKIMAFIERTVEMYRKQMLAFKTKLSGSIKGMPDGAGEAIASKSLVRAFGEPSHDIVSVQSAKNVLDSHEEVGKLLSNIANDIGPVCEKIIEAVKDKSKSLEEISHVAAEEAKKVFEGTLKGKRLVDGMHVEVTAENGWGRPEFKSDWTGKEPKEGAKIDAMTKSQVEAMLKQVDTMMKDAIKESTNVSKAVRAANAKLDEVGKVADVEEDRKRAGALAISKAVKDFYAVAKEVYNLQNAATKDALTYCKESISAAHSKAKGEKKAEGGEGK